MKILLLGSTGLAGSAFKAELISKGIKSVCIARSNSDINIDLSKVGLIEDILKNETSDGIINAAAQVDINQCEIDPITSCKINCELVARLSVISSKLALPLLQISTDHYYNYGKDTAHKETDKVILLNNYAKQKYKSEIHAINSKHALVLRTSIIGYGVGKRKTLIDWAIDNLQKGKTINLYKNAFTSAIDVRSFARIACEIFFDYKTRGLLNLCCGEVFSKELLIRTISQRLNLKHKHCPSVEIETHDKL